jgi:hypothetical protein
LPSFAPAPSAELQTFSKILYRSFKLLLNAGDKKLRTAATLTIHASDGTAPFDFSPKRELIELDERAVRVTAYSERKRHRECGFFG